MTIDAKELREAISYFEGDSSNGRRLDLLVEAASAYAATLPREVECWVVVDEEANRKSFHYRQEQAERYVSEPRLHVVRLTGLVTLPPREKD